MANTMKALQTVTVGAGGAASVTFSGIPQTYTDLIVKVSARVTNSGGPYGFLGYFLPYGTSYKSSQLGGDGTNAFSQAYAFAVFLGGNTPGASETSNTFNNTELYIPSYASNTKKSITAYSVAENNATTAYQYLVTNTYETTTPVTSIVLGPSSGTLAQYSTFTLYGVFNQDVSSAPSTPTIGTATDAATSGQVSVAFTPVSGAASYAITSSPGSITATGTTSPITVSGLTNNTSYTFTCQANNPIGSSALSAASNSVTPTAQYNSIATVSYASGTGGDVIFTNIPTTYRHLQIRMFMRDTRSATDSTWFMQFNGDTGNNYSYQGMGANGSTINNVTSTGTNSMQGITSGATAGANRFGSAVIDIFDVNQTNKFKTSTYQSGYTNNGSGNVYLIAGTWLSTAAISSITIKPNTGFAQYSHFALYGIG